MVLSLSEADATRELFFATYPGLRDWQAWTAEAGSGATATCRRWADGAGAGSGTLSAWYGADEDEEPDEGDLADDDPASWIRGRRATAVIRPGSGTRSR